MSGRLAPLLAAVVLVAGPAQAKPEASNQRSTCPQVEIAAVAQQPGASGPDKTTLVSPPEVVDAYVNITEGQPVLNLSFKPEAARKVRDFTAAHVGGSIAMIVDGKVARVVKVLDPITGDGVLISPVERPAADDLAAKLKACATGQPPAR